MIYPFVVYLLFHSMPPYLHVYSRAYIYFGAGDVSDICIAHPENGKNDDAFRHPDISPCKSMALRGIFFQVVRPSSSQWGFEFT